MARPKGQGKTPGSGRKKGTPNVATRDMKEAMYQAFEAAGGVDYLKKLAKDEPRTFGTLLGKLIPAEIKADVTLVDLEAILNARARASD